jgi:CRP/FNR family transcriptional regulator
MGLAEPLAPRFDAPFLSDLGPAGRARLHGAMQRRTLRDKHAFLHEGDACRSLLFVESGALRVFKTGEQGREITLYRVRPGELCLLSISSLLAGTPYTASVAASGPTVAWELGGDDFRALHATEPALQQLVATQLHRLLADVMALVSEVAFKRVDERLAGWLLDEASSTDVVHTTHERLAQHLGTAREVVSRLLENLRDDGLVQVERGVVRLVDRRALAEMARR